MYLLSCNLASLASSLGQSSMLLFQEMASSFSKLCHLTGQHSVSLTNFLQRGKAIKSLVLIKNTAIFIDIYKEQVYYSYSKREQHLLYFKISIITPKMIFILRYSDPVGNFLVMGGFQSLLKPSQCVVISEPAYSLTYHDNIYAIINCLRYSLFMHDLFL